MFLEHIQMISEVSCDTEDWSNEAGLKKIILKYIQIEKIIKL